MAGIECEPDLYQSRPTEFDPGNYEMIILP